MSNITTTAATLLQVSYRAYRTPKIAVAKKGWRHYQMNCDCHCLGSQLWLYPDEEAKGGICANWLRDVVPVALHYKENCAKSWVSDVSGILCGVRSEGI